MAGLEIPSVKPAAVGGIAGGTHVGLEVNPYGGATRGFGDLEISADKIAATIKKTQLERDSTNLVKTEGEYLAQTDDAISKLDPLSKDYNQRVAEIYKNTRDGLTETADLSTREAKVELQTRLERISNVGTVSAIHAQRTSVQAEAVRTYDTASNTVFAQIRKDPAAADTYVSGFQADAARLTSGISPDNQRKMDEKFSDGVVTAKALGFADRGNFAAAKAVLDANMGTLNPGQEQKARYQIEAIENKMRTDSARGAANVHADISAKIADWKYNPDPTAAPPVTRDDLQKMRGQFVNNPGAWSSLVHELDQSMAMRSHAQQSTREALANASNGSLRNQAEADLAFNAQFNLGGKKPAELMTPEYLTLAGTFARDQGYIPSVFKAQIENAGKLAGVDANSKENVDRLATAAASYDRINELAPNSKWGFADDKGSSVLLVSSMVKSEQISAIEAARRVLSMSPADNTVIVNRQKGFEDAFKALHGTGQGQNALSWTSNQIVGVVGPMINVPKFIGGSGTPAVDPSVSMEYQKKLKENFVKVPDIDVAKKATDDWMKQNYSVTQIGDRNEVVRFAPEKYFDPTIADRVKSFGSKIIDDDVSAILKAHNVIPGKNTFSPNMPGYRLWADDRTAKEAGQWEAAGPSPDGTSNRTPVTYRIQVLDQFGNYQDVNGPRYRLPTAKEISETNNTFRQNEYNAVKEFGQPSEAGRARSAITPNRKANDSGAIGKFPSAEDLGSGRADTGVPDPRAPKGTLTFDEVQKRRRAAQGYEP